MISHHLERLLTPRGARWSVTQDWQSSSPVSTSPPEEKFLLRNTNTEVHKNFRLTNTPKIWCKMESSQPQTCAAGWQPPHQAPVRDEIEEKRRQNLGGGVDLPYHFLVSCNFHQVF